MGKRIGPGKGATEEETRRSEVGSGRKEEAFETPLIPRSEMVRARAAPVTRI